jgi:hypothetical protein
LSIDSNAISVCAKPMAAKANNNKVNNFFMLCDFRKQKY